MSEPEPSVPSEPALHEAGHDHDHEHDHPHEEGSEASGVLKVKGGCGKKCADCMACKKKKTQ